VHGGVRPLAPD